MKKSNVSALLLVIVCTLFAPTYCVAQTIINFDTDPYYNPIPSTTVIDNTYSLLGVTFSCVGSFCDSNNEVYAVSAPTYATSDPNVVSTHDYTPVIYSNVGLVRATFNCPGEVNSVSIQAIAFRDNSAATLRAFNSGGTMITGSTDYMPIAGNTTELTVNASDIAYVEFAGLSGPPDNYMGSVFDDLQFICQGSVPSMTQWGLMAFMVFAGIGAVYYIYHRKRNTIKR